jgi:hypothetical protein
LPLAAVLDLAGLAARPTEGDASTGVFLIVAVSIALAAYYMIGCAFFPWANCRRCGGGGRKYSPAGRAFRDCRKCKGSGRRVRAGRRLWDWYRSSR